MAWGRRQQRPHSMSHTASLFCSYWPLMPGWCCLQTPQKRRGGATLPPTARLPAPAAAECRIFCALRDKLSYIDPRSLTAERLPGPCSPARAGPRSLRWRECCVRDTSLRDGSDCSGLLPTTIIVSRKQGSGAGLQGSPLRACRLRQGLLRNPGSAVATNVSSNKP